MANEQTELVSGSWAHWGTDAGLRSAIWAARRLPYEKRIAIFGALSRNVLTRVGKFSRRMHDNLDYIWPEMPAIERNHIVSDAADNIGRAAIEHYSMTELTERMAGIHPIGDGVSTLMESRERGQPAIILTGHFGNYEAIWANFHAHGVPLGGFYRPMGNPYVNRHYVETVKMPGSGPLFAQDRAGMGRLLRHLKGGGGVLMLNDLYVGSGIEMDFLGKPAMTALSAAELALRVDAPLLPAFSTRRADGVSFDIEVDAAIPPSDPETMTAAFNRAIEARIEKHPGQWFWMHRRWKKKWNRGKGMASDLHPAALPRRKSG